MTAKQNHKLAFGQPLATRDLLVDVSEYRGHGEALEEGMPWLWGGEVETPPVIPDETDSSFEPVLGSTPLKSASK